MARTTAADRLSLIVLGALAALAIRHRELSSFALVMAAALVLLAIAAWAQHSPIGEIVHKICAPYLAVGTSFELLGPMLARTPARFDGVLASMDARYFGPLVSAWQGALGRPAWLTDVMSVAYVSFYALPLAVGVAIYRRSPQKFDRFALATEAAFFLPYLGYILVPAYGPRGAFEQGAALGGTFVGHTARAFVHAMELNMLDAFPSAHTSVVLVVLVFGWRLLPKWRAPLALIVASILFSTVYLSYHYVVDLIAGAGVALAIPALAPLGRALGLHPLPIQSPSMDIRSG